MSDFLPPKPDWMSDADYREHARRGERGYETLWWRDDPEPAAFDEAKPNGHKGAGASKGAAALPPEPNRDRLTLDRDIPPRDYLLGGVMCEMAAAIAVAAFLKWPGQRRARVLYLDGELPMETFKERMQLIADRHGKD